ncbi:MAG: hypothetical protein HDT37_05545 [Clostridiales bacterium]|nr:hypothetical protein [Clostridiales bacterium]
MEHKLTIREGRQLAQKRLKAFLQPLGFQSYPRPYKRFLRVRKEWIDEISFDTDRIHGEIICYIFPRFAPLTWLRCDRERLWRVEGKPVSDLNWSYVRLLDEGLDYFEAVWQDITHAIERKVLPQMEQMTADTFLSRQTQFSNDVRDLFLPYQNQVLSLQNQSLICNPIAAGHGMELWHLGRFDEGVPYLQFAQKGYHSQLAGLAPEEREVFHKRFIELALLEELLALWEHKEGDWKLAIRRKLDQIAADWSMYV